MTDEALTPIDAINEFYRLKDKYTTDYNNKYISDILHSKQSNKKKRVDFSRLPKPECINCKRNVGTIFTIKADSENLVRKFVAKCGDITDPCPLDIQIDYSIREQYKKTISKGLKNIERLKLDIIKQKNNLLFFNNDTTVINAFKHLTDELSNETESTGLTIETDILKNDNPEKKALLSKMVDEFGKGFLLPFKQMIQDYMSKNDELVLHRAIQFYIDEMIPKLKEIRQLKYEVNFVEYIDNTYYLIQQTNSIESMEEYFEKDDKVIKFVRGVKKASKTTRKIGVNTSNNKTKKLKPTLQLVEEDAPEEAPIEEEEAEAPIEGPVAKAEQLVETIKEPVLKAVQNAEQLVEDTAQSLKAPVENAIQAIKEAI